MGRKLEIEWNDFSVTVHVELADETNPELCESFWQTLPFQTVFAASMSAGEMLKIPLPVTLPSVNPDKLRYFPDLSPGSIVSLGMGVLLLNYGVVFEPFKVPVIGHVPDMELDRLRNVAIKLRDAYFFTKQVNIATLRRRE